MQIDVMGELKANGEVRSLSCNRCFRCTTSCPKGAIAFNLKRSKISLSSPTAERIDKVSLKRRKLSNFDIIISVLWIGISAAFIFTGINQSAPQEIKVIMQVGLILVIYGLIWIGQKIFFKLRKD